ncbi:MAG: M48 family metallopeptidase [bacterium]
MNQELSLSNLTEPREEAYFIIALVFSILAWLACVVTIIPIAYVVVIGLFIWLANGLLVAQLKADAVLVDQTQFPALAGTFARVCAKLQVAKVPELYVVQSNGVLNAFATRHCGRNFVVVFSEILDAYGADSPEIEFLLGHEIGHIQRSHLQKRLLLFPGLILPLLGNAYHRACEFTCDRYGAFATSDPQGAVRAMMVLAGGRQAKQSMSPESFARQYAGQRGFFVSWYELISGYPTLSRRVANLIAVRDGGTLQRAPRNFFAYPFAFFTFGGTGGGGANALITVAIIALLAAIAIPSFVKSRQDSRRSQCVNNLRLIDHAKAQLAVANPALKDAYVPTLAELQPYLRGRVPACRDGGTYSVNAITCNPTCSRGDPPFKHALSNESP